MDILRRSVAVLLKQQDERGSFNTDEAYLSGDKVDDQLGAASMLAFYLTQTGPDDNVIAALERGVRFHLDHLVCTSPTRPFRYSRYYSDRDSSGDWCNTQWCLWGGALTLLHGKPYLSERTMVELRDLLADYWSLLSGVNSWRDENPCHNQVLAYCNIGIIYGTAIGNTAIVSEALNYYHQHVRNMRIHDRGHWVYSEFNQWDAHYTLLSWTELAHIFAATGDPAAAEDADEMAMTFNERVSAGGYYWGGSRYSEGGMEEFVDLPSAWAQALGLNRLLMPEPSHLWQKLWMDGHHGRSLVTRMTFPLQKREIKPSLAPTPWHFLRGDSSVCLRDDLKLHHLSAAGLEVISSANAAGQGSGVAWLNNGEWKNDLLQLQPPAASLAVRYNDSKPLEIGDTLGLASMQRGYLWETRQWWISTGKGLLWIGHLMSHHSFIVSDAIDFILGNPVITRLSGKAVPVTEVETADGIKADTQGDVVTISSSQYLKLGDVFIGATVPLEFVRPSKDAFHTFPTSRPFRDFNSSNELRLHLSDVSTATDCRESLFFAVEIGQERPSLVAHRDPHSWKLEARAGIFEAHQSGQIWSYCIGTSSTRQQLPQIGFAYKGL